MRPFRARSGGFTLLELLVAMAAMGVVTSLGVRAFFGLTDAWRDTRRVAELEVAVQAAFDVMRDDFGRTISGEISGEAVNGESRSVTDPRFFQQVLGDDLISLPVFAAPAGRPVQAMRVEYYADRGESGSTLVRQERDLDGGEMTPKLPILERGDVLRLRFEFADPSTGAWTDSWSRPEMPAAVRASMTVGYRDDVRIPGPPKPQISRKAVFPIRVR